MEKIIKEKIITLKVRYERLLEMCKTEHVTQSFKEFYKNKLDVTNDQIMLLEEILATHNQR